MLQLISPYVAFDCHLADHREFTESPIPGYTGYVPKKMEHELGSTYGNWSGKAYVDSLASKRLQEKTSIQPIELTRYVS